MKCPICSVIEMYVMENNGTEIMFECPNCHQQVREKIVNEESE